MIITLKDGSTMSFDAPMSVKDIAQNISEGLARNAVCGKIGDTMVDLETIIDHDCSLSIVTLKDEDGLHVLRHTTSHVLAQAVKNLYPTCKLAIGPAIATGFYYDFEMKTPITQDDFDKIEKEMQKIIKADMPMSRFELPRTEAIALMKKLKEPYKVELIKNLPPKSVISFYKQGEFIDLCAGPHLPSTGKIKAFKLTSLAGAYWRGDEKNKMLTRIYGTSFEKKSELEAYLTAVEEAKKRDHNKIGRDLGYFMTDENIGQGLPLLMPKGAKLYQILTRFVEDEEDRRGYVRTKTPYMAKSNLYKISGHWDHYLDGMFVMGEEGKDEEVFALRPMTCPFQYTIYNNGLKSYRDLPIRYGETSTLFRNEASGEMHGLIRVRQFTISEGHIVCTPSQLESEFKGCVDLIHYFLRCIGLDNDVTFRFSKWDPKNTEKYINDPEKWEMAESTMKNILDHLGIKYYEAVGEAAFYGPKLDVQIRNVYGKEDTIITVQIDMFLAKNFNMTYVDESGNRQMPYIIHRTSIGCYERTMALLLEKYAGAMPCWLAPEQVRVISLTDRTADIVKETADKLGRLGIRCETDVRSEKVGYKIREAQLEKIPYMLIIGDKEAEANKVAIRHRAKGDLGQMTLDEFIALVRNDVDNKVLD